ncbi:MAG: DNA translocase FtsK 4TM domain-containing protein [Succinivibrionaceae bacterium]|nr:DNA translocase FtsK 4TM domain-containing protein [Succinivibrionaceae bacterium]
MLSYVSDLNNGEKLSGPRRVLESVFIIMVLFSVFLFLAICSHDSADPGWSQTATGDAVANLMGSAGALVSDLLLFLFGYGAFIVPLTLIYLGFCLFVKRYSVFEVDFFTVGLRIIGYICLALSLLCLMSMNIVHGDFLSGGIIGNLLAAFFISWFGEMGTSLLFLAMMLCSVPLFTGVSLLSLCDATGELFFALAFHRSYSQRRKAEMQLAANAESRRSIEDELEEENEAGQATVFDEATGFSIYLRDDDEIRYVGSSYDDDDDPQLKSDVAERRAAERKAAESASEAPGMADDAKREPVPDIPWGATAHAAEEASVRAASGAPVSSFSAPVGSMDASSSSAPAASASSKSAGRDDLEYRDVPLGDISSLMSSDDSDTAYGGSDGSVEVWTDASSASDSSGASVSCRAFGSGLSSESGSSDFARSAEAGSAAPGDAETVAGASFPSAASGIAYPATDPDDGAGEAGGVSSAYSGVAVDLSAMRTSGEDDEERDCSSYQTSSNFGAHDFADSDEPSSGAGDTGFDDIPDFLPPGQKSVLDDDYEEFDAGSLPPTGAAPAAVRPLPVTDAAALDLSESAEDDDVSGVEIVENVENGENIDDYFTSLHQEVTPQLLASLRGRYDPNRLPSIDLLNPVPPKPSLISSQEIAAMSVRIEDKLREYRIEVKVQGYEVGPVITRFAVEPSAGTKVSRIKNISADLARVLAVQSVRVVDVIPGTTYIGLEIPNPKRQTVYFRELIDSQGFRDSPHKLTCGLGCSVIGKPQAMNLAKMPHLLVAGTTGSGKSVGVNGMILSMLYKSSPDDLRMILIDPKMLEFSSYDGIPHLLTPVVTDMKDATCAIRWCVGEMERRYKIMSKINVKNFDGYNAKVLEAIDAGKPIPDPLWERTGQLSDKRPYLGKLPYIVLVIDELADMMMQIGKKVEELIARLAQKARAAGIHMIIATQSPRADVLTGLIKSNIPSRLAFTVANGTESRIILEQMGAETLLGNGDMLFNPTGARDIARIHGAYVTPEEIDRIVGFWKSQGAPEYVDKILDDEVTEENALPSEKPKIAEDLEAASKRDDDFATAVRVIIETGRASTSVLQTRMGVGYPRAAKLLFELEQAGCISQPQNAAGKRKVLVDESYLANL